MPYVINTIQKAQLAINYLFNTESKWLAGEVYTTSN